VTTAAPTTVGSTTPTSAPASPVVDAESWETLTIGQYILAKPIAFVVEMEGAELKTDDQKASGTDKTKIKINGVDNAKGKIKFSWCCPNGDSTNDDTMFTLIMGLDPNGPAKGQPQDVVNPEFTLKRIAQIVALKWGKLVRKGDHREIDLDFKEWTAPAKATAGATTTPKSATPPQVVKGFGGDPGQVITITHPNPPSTSP